MTKKTIVLTGFVLAKFILQYILVNPEYELQRDEFLHLDQANHLAWGYISVPPVTSWISVIILFLGKSLFWVRFFPALFGAITLLVVWKAIEAGKILEEKGISVEVINIHTIKPLDEEAVLNSIRKTKCAVTAEEHNIIGGLGDSIAQLAAKNFPVPIEYIGTNDTFGESGKPLELLKKYGLDTDFIVAAAEKVMARK